MSDGIAIGRPVRVLALDPPGHVRVPWFLRGRSGRVAAKVALHRDPEHLAYGRRDGPTVAVWRVRFNQVDLWPDYRGHPMDSVTADLFETWLERLP
jgi:nitrile hydratase